ncbi:helix-turn-helix domain-containing protein [Stenotrophomonas maltophilia]|uniref:helix-turn-helix domain-containing protein n=1 Tax=Stenotrophomonas maltophilia TaxID=40324 RepID=UPI000D0B5D16|nr:hypothetical protein C6Y55_09220 [Stenotrophomonas maltophilia]
MLTLPYPTLSTLVRRARLHCGDSQQKFALRLGKSQAVVSRYESGKVDPPGNVVMHCMHILGLAPAPTTERGDGKWEEVTEALAALTHAVKRLRPANSRRT